MDMARQLFPTVLLTMVVLGGIIVATALPSGRGTVVAVFSPLVDDAALISAVVKADVRLVAIGSVPGTVVVYSDRSGVAGRLRRAGALLVLNPMSAVGCGGSAPVFRPPLTFQG
ncbi:MAG: hypothetical protein D6763_01510 [Alphaproteobacteria bacterium]|nr:MAG: hypothetical protein D6763_01510 [Alphaproteobacteria bacterium]